MLFFVSHTSAQQSPDFKKLMEESEKEKVRYLPEYSNSVHDYEQFKSALAQQSNFAESSIFSNVKELDINNIGGRVRSILVDRKNGIALAAPSGGGVWNFDPDNGAPFSPVNDLGSFMAVTDISQNPFNKSHIIISTGDLKQRVPGNGIFQSFDGGTTFEQIKSIKPILHSSFSYISMIRFSPVEEHVIYMCDNGSVGYLYKSTDGGDSWTEVFNANYNRIRTIDFLEQGGIILGVDRKGVFKSDSGDLGTFQQITNGIPFDVDGRSGTISGVAVATHAANRNIAYAFITGDANEIYKTLDGGINWLKMTTPDFYIAATWFCLTIGVHPTNPDIVVAGSVGWGYTTDGGVSWIKGAGLEVDFHEVYFNSQEPDIAYLGYDQGIGKVDFSKSAEYWIWNGSESVKQSQAEQLEIGKAGGFNTTQIYFGDYFPEEYGDAFIEGQQDAGCFAVINDYNNRVLVGDGGSIFISKQNPNKAFACTQYGNLYRTGEAVSNTRYGMFDRLDTFYYNHPNFITQFAGNDADGDQFFMATNSTIEATFDGGENFTAIASHSLSNVKVATEYSLDPTVYAVGYNMNVSPRTTDLIRISNVASINDVKLFTDIIGNYQIPDQIHVNPNDKNTVYITSTLGQAYKVKNLDTDVPIVSSLNGVLENLIFNTVIGLPNRPDLLIAGTNIGVFYSSDDGDNWTLSNDFPYTQVTDLKFRESDNRLFVFTYGRGAWAATLEFDGCQPTWPAITLSSNSTVANCKVKIQGVPASIGDKVGAFVGAECRGIGTVEVVNGESFSEINIQGEIEEEVTFKIWDESECEEFNVCGSYTTNPGGNIGIPPNYLVLDICKDSIQVLVLENAGWNLKSCFVDTKDKPLSELFGNMPANILQVKTMTESWDPTVPDFLNTLKALKNEEVPGYFIKSENSGAFEIKGAYIGERHAKPSLSMGWNLIGYPYDTQQDIAIGYNELIRNSQLVQIKNMTSSFDPTIPEFLNTLNEIEPGGGYFLKVNAEVSDFVYPQPQQVTKSGYAYHDFACNWKFVGYEQSTIVYGEITFNGEPVSENAIIGAFVNGECRSIDKVILNKGRSYASMVINGNEKENVSFRLWQNNTSYVSKSMVSSQPGESIKTILNISFSDEEDLVLAPKLTTLPNPFCEKLKIKITLDIPDDINVNIYSSDSRLVNKIIKKSAKPGVHKFEWDTHDLDGVPCAPGIYFVQVYGNSGSITNKVLLTN